MMGPHDVANLANPFKKMAATENMYKDVTPKE